MGGQHQEMYRDKPDQVFYKEKKHSRLPTFHGETALKCLHPPNSGFICGSFFLSFKLSYESCWTGWFALLPSDEDYVDVFFFFV